MKTLIAASALALVSNIAVAHDYEASFQSPDVNPQYGAPYWIEDNLSSGIEVTPSIEAWYRGNPDAYAGYADSSSDPTLRFGSSAVGTTSLDLFNKGNPDTYSGS